MGRSIDEDHMKLVRAIARYVGEGSFAFLFLHPTMDPEYASSLAELVGRAVRISGGSIYAVIPTPDVYATGKKDLAPRLEALRMIKGGMDIVRSSFRKGIPATSVSYRDIAKISRMIELSRTP
jgi:kynureninase